MCNVMSSKLPTHCCPAAGCGGWCYICMWTRGALTLCLDLSASHKTLHRDCWSTLTLFVHSYLQTDNTKWKVNHIIKEETCKIDIKTIKSDIKIHHSYLQTFTCIYNDKMCAMSSIILWPCSQSRSHTVHAAPPVCRPPIHPTMTVQGPHH